MSIREICLRINEYFNNLIIPTGTTSFAIDSGIPASSSHSLIIVSRIPMPLLIPPATMLSYIPGKVCLALDLKENVTINLRYSKTACLLIPKSIQNKTHKKKRYHLALI